MNRWHVLMAFCWVFLMTGCAGLSGPLIPPNSSWNPYVTAAYSPGYPCNYVTPYFEGYDADGVPRCTVRPFDPLNEDVDTGEEP